MREWKELFISGQPLYEQADADALAAAAGDGEPSPQAILEEERQRLLDEGDFNEYRVNNCNTAWFIDLCFVKSPCLFLHIFISFGLFLFSEYDWRVAATRGLWNPSSTKKQSHCRTYCSAHLWYCSSSICKWLFSQVFCGLKDTAKLMKLSWSWLLRYLALALPLSFFNYRALERNVCECPTPQNHNVIYFSLPQKPPSSQLSPSKPVWLEKSFQAKPVSVNA